MCDHAVDLARRLGAHEDEAQSEVRQIMIKVAGHGEPGATVDAEFIVRVVHEVWSRWCGANGGMAHTQNERDFVTLFDAMLHNKGVGHDGRGLFLFLIKDHLASQQLLIPKGRPPVFARFLASETD